MDKLVIVGGVAAGPSAAAKARRVDAGLQIRVFAAGEYISYGGCGLPYLIGGRLNSPDALLVRSVEQFAGQNIQVCIRHEVLKIDTAARRLLVRNLDAGEEFEESYDRLVIATGARPIRPDWPGIDLEGVFTLRTIPDSLAIIDYLRRYQPRHAVIVGAGYIGLEMIENLLFYGCRVSVIQGDPQVLPGLDADMAAKVEEYLQGQGIQVYTGLNVQGFEGDGLVRAIVTENRRHPAEMVILAIGVQPNSELAAAAGIKLGVKNAIRVNERCETSAPQAWAAGDCATVRHLLTGQDEYIAMGTNANKQGRAAGANAAGESTLTRGVLGTSIARIMEMEVSRTGLNEAECRLAGIEFCSHMVQSRTAAHYCPAAGRIWLKITASKKDLRLLGAQIVGFAGAGKRIDALATAITAGCKAEELFDMDLAYSPPFSPVRDPILIALDRFRK